MSFCLDVGIKDMYNIVGLGEGMQYDGKGIL